MRGSSRLIKPCNDFSSSAKSSFSRLCGLVAIFDLLLTMGQREADAERRPTSGPIAVNFDGSLVIRDDAIHDRQPQPRPLPIASARKERLENLLEHVGRHAAAIVRDQHLGL